MFRNQLVRIGNGFDLAHGLKTGYSSFISDFYSNILSELHGPNMKYSDSNIEVVTKKYFQLNDKIVDPMTCYFELQQDGYIYQTKISTLFSKLASSALFGWVDVESIYFECLIEVLNSYRNPKKINEKKQTITGLINLNIQFDELKNKLLLYLSKIDKDINIHNSISDKFQRIITSSGNSNTRTMFLNFNYTQTIEKYPVLDKYSRIDINYIHGNLQDKSSDIIFGYGDELSSKYSEMEEIEENAFLKNIKSFGYFRSNSYRKLLDFLDISKRPGFDIHSMGHSGGVSDRVLLNTLFENENCRSIYIYWNKDDPYDFENKTMQFSRHFKDKQMMRRRIQDKTKCSSLS